MNGSVINDLCFDKPLSVVCDDACLLVVNSAFSSPVTPLAEWLSSPCSADIILCSAQDENESVRAVRAIDQSVFVVAIVESLQSDVVMPVLRSGADDVLTVQEVVAGRLNVMLNQRFHSLSPHRVDSSYTASPIAVEASISSQNAKRDDLELRNNFMSVLSDVSMRLLERKSIDELMDHIALQVISLAGVDSAFVSMVHETDQYMEIVGTSGRFNNFKGFRHKREDDVVGLAWELEELVVIDSEVVDEHLIELWGSSTKRCAVPFFTDNSFSGVVCVALDSLDNHLENYLDILKLFTRTASIAIENTMLINEQKTEIARHTAIGEITRSFYSASNLRDLIDGVCQSLLNVFDSKHICVCRVGKDGKFLLLAEWQRNDGVTQRVNYVNVKLMASSISQWSVDNKLSGFVPRGVEDERDSDSVRKIKGLLGIGSSISLPLAQDGVVWGVLVIGKSIEQRDFTDVELSLLELLMSQLSSSVMRQNLLDKIHFHAFHDSLTKLPNRLKFESVLNKLVSSQHEKQEHFALLFLDLDGFKGVNDNQGHSVGDELLRQVSKRVVGCLQEKDILARMGGDEFAVLLRGVKTRQDAISIAHRLSDAVGNKFVVGKYNLKIGVSIGLSFYPENGETVDELLRNADFAMYEAKAQGNSSVKSFSHTMAQQYRDRIALENELQSAIESEQFELHYQPKVDLVNGLVIGVEALLRWRHPVHGFVSPEDFVSLAEEAGYITEIGKWALNEAVRQTVEWNRKGTRNLTMAVNISAPQFVLEDFSSGVVEVLKDHKLDPAQLELEVTESVVMNNLSKVVHTLDQLRNEGITIALDDFGTGYSSLAYLEKLPLDCIKIDQVFVNAMIAGSEKFSLVNTIITMAKALGLKTVAEGVENADQLSKLLALGCECVQGYYFARAVPAEEMLQTIDDIEGQFHSQRKAG